MCYYDLTTDGTGVKKTYYKNTDQLEIETIQNKIKSGSDTGT